MAILGCGGHARSIADIAIHCGFKELLFIDKEAKDQELLFGFPVLKALPAAKTSLYALGAGDNSVRQQQFEALVEQHLSPETLISPLSSYGLDSTLGAGSILAHHAHLGPTSRIGKACIINTGAVVEHDCEIGDFSHVAIKAVLAGGVTMGRQVFIGAGAVIRQGVSICDKAIIGAGATVVTNLVEPGIYVGTPARLLVKPS